MISFGAAKPAGAGALSEKIKGWASAMLPAQYADATLMVAELECKEPGCPPVETVISIMDKASPQKVKVLLPMAKVGEGDVKYALDKLAAAMGAPPMELTVELPNGRSMTVSAQALETVLTLKRRLSADTAIPLEQLRLLRLGTPMRDHAVLAEFDLKAGDTLHHGVGSSYFWQGNGTLAVPMTMHAESRGRLAEAMRADGAAPNSWCLLQGGEGSCRYDSDNEPLFRQESYFQWAFGVAEPDFYGAIEVSSGRSVLFMPRLPEEYAVWMGVILSPADIKAKYCVDEVVFTHEIDEFFGQVDGSGADRDPHPPTSHGHPLLLYTLYGRNSDSGLYAAPAKFGGIEKYGVDNGKLFAHIQECRVIKSEAELEVMRYVSDVTCKAHMSVMAQIEPGMREYQGEALFQHHVYFNGGCRNCAYTCICATGSNPAVLHYGHAGAPNAMLLRDGDMCLFDMGAEYHCYCSDVTVTFPANGVFTADQKAVYNAVLRATHAVEDMMRPGTNWADMHRLAWRVITEDLIELGVLGNGTVDEIMEARVPELFMACGLGHLIGLDTHDVGGYPRGVQRVDEPGIKALRTTRLLKENMCLTVEPGLYFNDYQMDKGLGNPAQVNMPCFPARLPSAPVCACACAFHVRGAAADSNASHAGEIHQQGALRGVPRLWRRAHRGCGARDCGRHRADDHDPEARGRGGGDLPG